AGHVPRSTAADICPPLGVTPSALHPARSPPIKGLPREPLGWIRGPRILKPWGEERKSRRAGSGDPGPDEQGGPVHGPRPQGQEASARERRRRDGRVAMSYDGRCGGHVSAGKRRTRGAEEPR
ncbi:unnamed protein product, partial [Ixodes persulcatus]